MQSTTRWNSAAATSAPSNAEQRDDAEYAGAGVPSREQAEPVSTHAASIVREHWSKRLRGSPASPTHEEYTCRSAQHDMSTANAQIAHVVDKLKSIQVPKSLFAASPLSNGLVADEANAAQSTSLGDMLAQRKQILSLIQSKSDVIAHTTSNSWNVLLEKAEIGKQILVERAEAGNFSNGLVQKLQQMSKDSSQDCYQNVGSKQHVREVSFDYQLMNDVEYSSAPCYNSGQVISRCE